LLLSGTNFSNLSLVTFAILGSRLLAALSAMTPPALLALSADAPLDPAVLSGGAFTVAVESQRAYQQPAPILNAAQLEQFLEGRKSFAQLWVVAPSILGLWGRGPTSNAEACTDCHENGGRGRAPRDAAEPMRSMLVRLSIPGAGAHGGPNPHPVYGDQLQNEGILGRVPPEGDPRLRWETRSVTMAGGEIVELRSPVLELRDLNFGPLGPEAMTSARVAPPLVGVGLLDAVSEDTIRTLAQEQQRNGLRGRLNVVWDLINNREALGRFGHKANQPSVEQQIIFAYHADLGVTSRWFPEENCTEVQLACLAEPPGGHPELPEAFLDPVLFYARALAVPARRNVNDAQVTRGETLFSRAGCDGCHSPTLETGNYPALPALSRQAIHPYTDLLLHDMGEGLADGRPDFRAGPRDWRTAPLWGVGLSQTVNGNGSLLHDGRARNFTEAILWHGGEAHASREAFRMMSRPEREALLAFLNSL
jgi:CxxC motif-containing protein (DUF1111 family)